MAIKKSELYSSLWASCDELRGGMEPSQYKDYVLVMLFVKYISDKYAGQPFATIKVPKGATFDDMVALKGKPSIGDDINKKIIEPIAEANGLSDMPDFADVSKLGDGKEMVDRLTNLISIFEDKRLDFSQNRADGDDIIGDAYEYLMRHFATESGKSKGQFYTPSEVSQIMAKIIGISPENSRPDTTVYDPTCGSGSLLLKVAEEADHKVTLFGQEKESTTVGLARMNMVLHNQPTALGSIVRGNTLTDPDFTKEDGSLRAFDYVVANPPFSDKRWSNGLTPEQDPYERFQEYGPPPTQNGDYAYLLHIVKSLKRKGKGACILPHGVLFRGHSEAQIRTRLIRKGYIKGIIGLPANLFYGTGIPACIVVVDKENAQNRKGIFMIDASSGYMKDGPKNRLRSMDIHKIVETFNHQLEEEGYSRMIPFEEIQANEFNLNIPRYIDSQEEEDIQDIEGHLKGYIPKADVDAMEEYWKVFPGLRDDLFQQGHKQDYVELSVAKEEINDKVFNHPEFTRFSEAMRQVFEAWRKETEAYLKALETGFNPKQVVADISSSLLDQYSNRHLVNKYDIYQHLMDYWAETMQDDCYQIAAEGWKAETYRIVETTKQGKQKDKGWACDLIPKELIVNRYFSEDQQHIDSLNNELESVDAEIQELEEENGVEDGAFSEMDKISKGEVQKRLKELKKSQPQLAAAAEPEVPYADAEQQEREVLERWLKLKDRESDLKKQVKEAERELDLKAYHTYPKLSEAEIKSLIVQDKWMTGIETSIQQEMDGISLGLAGRIQHLAERYDVAVTEIEEELDVLSRKVKGHLEEMGLEWN